MSARSIALGAFAGLAGGIVFGVLMQAMDMLGMVAALVGAESVAVGWGVHLVNSAIIGAIFGALLGGRLRSSRRRAALRCRLVGPRRSHHHAGVARDAGVRDRRDAAVESRWAPDVRPGDRTGPTGAVRTDGQPLRGDRLTRHGAPVQTIPATVTRPDTPPRCVTAWRRVDELGEVSLSALPPWAVADAPLAETARPIRRTARRRSH